MRDIEKVNAEIEEVKKELNDVHGTGTEVYARIVGYYRSVRNWNKGKREEYNHRVMFSAENDRIEENLPKGESSFTVKNPLNCMVETVENCPPISDSCNTSAFSEQKTNSKAEKTEQIA